MQLTRRESEFETKARQIKANQTFLLAMSFALLSTGRDEIEWIYTQLLLEPAASSSPFSLTHHPLK